MIKRKKKTTTESLREHGPEYILWYKSRKRAQASGIPFAIEPDDIKMRTYCPYLDIKLEFNQGQHQASSYTLDRIDNTKGYVPGNIEVISFKANQMKSNASSRELLFFARAILERFR